MKRFSGFVLGVLFLLHAPHAPLWAADDAEPGLDQTGRPSIFSVPDTPPENPEAPAAHFDVDSEDEEHPLGYGIPGVSLLGGGAFYSVSGAHFVTPEVAVRYSFSRRDADAEGPAALSPWSIEFGGIITKHESPSGDFDTKDSLGSELRNTDSASYFLHVTGVSEFHLAGQYQWLIRKPVRMVPQISLGLAMTKVDNDMVWVSNSLTSEVRETVRVTSLSPLVRFGLPILANDWFALRMDLGYAHFGDRFNFKGQSFNKTLSGVAFYPSVQISIGYLRSGIEAGEYLPSNALPLWALAAAQTEKKSPVIAAPEALLNPRQGESSAMLGNVMFQYKDRWAKKVEIVGDFNHWTPEPMYMDKGHVWITIKDFHPGMYHYAFLVNGRRELRDPWNLQFDPSQRAHGCSVFSVYARYGTGESISH